MSSHHPAADIGVYHPVSEQKKILLFHTHRKFMKTVVLVVCSTVQPDVRVSVATFQSILQPQSSWQNDSGGSKIL